MLLKHPGVKDLRILRIYSKSIETKFYYGPHSNKVTCYFTMCQYYTVYRYSTSPVLNKGVVKITSHMPCTTRYVAKNVDILKKFQIWKRYLKGKLPHFTYFIFPMNAGMRKKINSHPHLKE